ncbi:MAG: hypothetical protein IMF19_14885 [Proteobacteria bacterium]|nr:hypothetical protein [Pseudomonadota bacterium]
MENGMYVLSGEEIKQLVEGYKERKEGASQIRFRIILATDGLGSFTVVDCNTATGCSEKWINLGTVVPLRAKPASGYKFGHWDLDGNYMSSSPNHTCSPVRPCTITAHFVPE